MPPANVVAGAASGVADRISDTVVAIGWMIGSGVSSLLAIFATAVVMWNGYAGTQIEATWRERRYDTVGRGEFVLAFVIYPIISYILATNGWLKATAAGVTIPDWMTIALMAAGVFGIGQRIAVAMRLERSR